MTPGDHVSLRPVTRANVRAVCELELADDQRHLWARPPTRSPRATTSQAPFSERSVSASGRSAYCSWRSRRHPVPRAIHGGCRQQRAGIGRRAVELLLDELRVAGRKELETSFHPGADGAADFWVRCGFRGSGRKHHGEPVAVRAL